MTTTLVLGASGAIGQYLVPRLAGEGGRLLALSRSARSARSAPAVEWLRGDLGGTMPALPAIDTVISVGPLHAFSVWLARALDDDSLRGVTRVVAIGSMSAQSKRESDDPAERALAHLLRDAEARVGEACSAHRIDSTLLRPTLIYGSGRDASLAPLARFAARWRVLPVPMGATGLRQPVHADDLAWLCGAVRALPQTFGQTYEAGGGERLPFATLLRRIAHKAHALALPVPVAALRWLLPRRAGAIARLRTDLVADNAPALRDVGYAPRAFDAGAVLPRTPAG